MVGAGLFGFMINPPIALYYMQGLNTTPVHAHALVVVTVTVPVPPSAGTAWLVGAIEYEHGATNAAWLTVNV